MGKKILFIIERIVEAILVLLGTVLAITYGYQSNYVGMGGNILFLIFFLCILIQNRKSIAFLEKHTQINKDLLKELNELENK